MDYAGKKILVLGLGDTGLSALRFMKARGAEVSASDSRNSPPRLEDALAENVPILPFDERSLAGVCLLVTSPGLAQDLPILAEARNRGIEIVGDVEIFARELKSSQAKVLAITGSNGKSTVTEMVGLICKEAGLDTVVCGNIGLPVLDAIREDAQAYVIELSSFQLETLKSLEADFAAVLNVSEDHLDRYSGMGAYAAAKARIFQGSGIQVLNRNDVFCLSMKMEGRKCITFGLDEPENEEDYGLSGGWLVKGKQKLMPVSELKVAGLHNAANALSALALCEDIPMPVRLRALKNFKGLPHRVEKVGEIEGVVFYDDSKGTNVGATVAALSGMKEKAVVILGGEGKGQDFSPLKQAVKDHARAAVLIGRDAGLIANNLESVPVYFASDMFDAVSHAFKEARSGDCVLLSPACASFDMFDNYAHRAEVFIQAVGRLRECSIH